MRKPALSAALVLGGLMFAAIGTTAYAATTKLKTDEPVVQTSTVSSPKVSAPVKLAAATQPAAPAAPAPVIYTVQAGDTLTKIAQDNNSETLRIFYANTDLADPDVINPGQQLRIPTADEQLAPREVPTNAPVVVATPVAATPAHTAPVARTSNVIPSDGSVWDQIAACESGNNWAINTGNGFYGGLQFTLGSWRAVGGSGMPNEASREEQIMRGQMLQARQGWGAWPACTAKLGLR